MLFCHLGLKATLKMRFALCLAAIVALAAADCVPDPSQQTPDFENASVSGCTGSKAGETCQVTCPAGFIGGGTVVCTGANMWSPEKACRDEDGCLGNQCDMKRSTCMDVPGKSWTTGQPKYMCKCKPGFSGDPSNNGAGCVRPNIHTDGNKGLIIQVGSDQDVAFRIGRDSTTTVKAIDSTLDHIDMLNSEIAGQIANLTSDVSNMTVRVMTLKNDVDVQASGLSEFQGNLADASSEVVAQAGRLSAAASTIASAQSVTDMVSDIMSQQVPQVAEQLSTLTQQGAVQVAGERQTRNGYRSDLDQVELAAEYLAERTGQLNDSHNAIFQAVDSLLTDQITLESSRAQAVEADLEAAINETDRILQSEVSRAAAASGTVMNETQLEAYFSCESGSSDGKAWTAFNATNNDCVQRYKAYGFQATLATTKSVGNSYQIVSGYGSVNFNEGSMFTASSGKLDKISMPGMYFFTVNMFFSGLSSTAEVLLTVNDTTTSGVGYRAYGYSPSTSYYTKVSVSGAFNLSTSDTVAVYVKTGQSSSQLRAYSTFAGVALTQSTRGFGAHLKNSLSSFSSGANPRPYSVDGTFEFASSSDDFDATSGTFKSTADTPVLVGMALNIQSSLYRGYGYPILNGYGSTSVGNSLYWQYTSPNWYSINFDGNQYMQPGTSMYFYFYTYGYSMTALSDSHFSAVALPDGQPIISFLARLTNTKYFYSYQDRYQKVGGWYADLSSSYKSGPHNIGGGFDVSSGDFTAPRSGIYYCIFRPTTYYLYSNGVTRLEIRVNDKSDANGGGYSEDYSTTSYFYFYNTPRSLATFLKVKKGDKISPWFGSTSSTYYSYYYIQTSYTFWGCTMIGTSDD